MKTKRKIDTCILCGKNDILTGEHIFADWLGKILKDADAVGSRSSLTTATTHSLSFQDGNPVDKTLDVLCKDCNNGWGSVLQQKTIKHLTPLVQGEWRKLDNGGRKVLSAWITSFAMVREYYHSELTTTSQAVREEFRRTGIPPIGWQIWTAPFSGSRTRNLETFHRALLTNGSVENGKPNAFMLIFVAGKLAIFVMGISALQFQDANPGITSTELELELKSISTNIRDICKSMGMARIWPLGMPFPADPPGTISDAGFERLMFVATIALMNGGDFQLAATLTSPGWPNQVYRQAFAAPIPPPFQFKEWGPI